MKDTKEFLTEMQRQHQRFFPEASVVYLEDLTLYVKVRIVLGKRYIIELRFNARNGKKSYALVRDGGRISGFDNLGGWHIHPFGEPEIHRRISEPSLADAFQYFLGGI